MKSNTNKIKCLFKMDYKFINEVLVNVGTTQRIMARRNEPTSSYASFNKLDNGDVEAIVTFPESDRKILRSLINKDLIVGGVL